MVTFIPPYMGEEIKSNAEKKMYNILQELNIEDAFVLHSLGLPRHQSKIYGEIDFVVVCRRGVACLEIKGGRVECREGKWFFIDRYGTEHQKPEGPFAQVVGNMFSLRSELKNRFSGNPHIKNVLVACGVVFPDIEFKSSSQEIIQEIIYDSRTENITEYINRVFDYWTGRQHREPGKLSKSDVEKIVDYLRGDFTFIPILRDRLAHIEQRLVRLTNEQAQIMNALGMNSHLLIEGSAGTGKTLLASEFAKNRAERGDRVLYLTFNKNLANHINGHIQRKDNLKVVNIHALFGEYVAVDVTRMKENPQKYFGEELPEQFFEWMKGLSSEQLDELKYDLIVMDEGQDIIKPVYLYSLDVLLKNGLEKGEWAIFYDEKQNIYNPEYADGMEIIESYACTKFKLFMNCRNTVQIGTYSSKASGVEIREFLHENGEEVQKISYTDLADFKKKIKEILKYLRGEKIDLADVTFLGPKKYANSLLKQAGYVVNELGYDFDADSQLPGYSTIQGYKGLDSKIVILINTDDISNKNFSKFMYIAGTRARTLLYVVASEDFWKKHNI
ncbi:NERD domain-containing protein/DEAD/DEAH box helicase [Blautia schinkii]|nr:NERD domain-containing protein/DEAD/DEAH box helicase [Blautia schinkii]